LDANEALADLQQISVQVVHALVVGADGAVEACTLPDAPSAERMARASSELWETADRARSDLGRDSLSQLEVSTHSGSVFVVQDDRRRVVATTAVDPTVGLVFYDLKTCLRQIGDAGGADATAAGIPPHLEAGAPDEPLPAGDAPAHAEPQEDPTEEHELPGEPPVTDEGDSRPFTADTSRTPLGDRLAGTEDEEEGRGGTA
jgi:predicted regulator of Ras-like GTPase activity (Roadblock/LC7/MglB family)